MRNILPVLVISSLFSSNLAAQPDTTGSVRRWGASAQSGFIISHSRDLRPISQTNPVGIELTHSHLRLDRQAWENGHCFAWSGVYVSYMDFRYPAVLGRMASLGGFFEPIITYGRWGNLSVRATGGLAYLSRIYDPFTNPENIFFGSPISALLALHLNASFRLTPTLNLTAQTNYNHISNGGIRQPNKGTNFPTVSVGLAWQPYRPALPNYQTQPLPLTHRWAGRVLASGSVNVLPATDYYAETPRPLAGLSGVGIYRLNRFHALAVGAEGVMDWAIRERIRRDTANRSTGQLGLLAGYELWQGRYRFGIQFGFNILQPGAPYSDRFYQRYQLLYALPHRLTLGVGLRATGHVAKGFDVRMGRELGK